MALESGLPTLLAPTSNALTNSMSSMRYGPILALPYAFASLLPDRRRWTPWIIPEAQLPTPIIPTFTADILYGRKIVVDKDFLASLLPSAGRFGKMSFVERLKDKVQKENLWFFLLVLLSKKPRYGYELRKLVRDEFGFWSGNVT